MNGFYRPPPPKSASKASASTLCQKCLKRGHYSYECKSQAQARPYVARPSRTQQLFNPKLVPKLTNDAPNDLLRKKGVADEQLAQIAAERKQNRDRSRSIDGNDRRGRRRRSQSVVSDASSSSVSTVSTNRSRTHSSPQRHPSAPNDSYVTSQSQHSPRAHAAHENGSASKRRRSPSNEPSLDSEDDQDRNTRRRRNEHSPEQRGRGRDRLSASQDRGTRSRSASSRRAERRARKHSSDAPDRSRSRSPFVRRDNAQSGPRDARPVRDGNRESSPRRSRQPFRKRSLSPFSKRLALTQVMGRGRG